MNECEDCDRFDCRERGCIASVTQTEEKKVKINFGLPGPNVVNSLATFHDCSMLFGDEEVIRLPSEKLQWEDVAVAAGFFPSKTRARKNGWIGPLPHGFGQRKFGKSKCVWFFNAINNQ